MLDVRLEWQRRREVTRSKIALHASATALALLLASCATWNSMDHQEKGTATGAAGGAVVGAAVGGPVGALVGAGVGGYAGHYETQPGGIAANANVGSTASTAASPTVRSAQQALNDRGYDVGAVDGVYGPNTQDAVVRFQQAQGLSQTGTLDAPTLSALGVSQ
jgi:murein L,D-transpeptidase YcbB/YkuD